MFRKKRDQLGSNRPDAITSGDRNKRKAPSKEYTKDYSIALEQRILNLEKALNLDIYKVTTPQTKEEAMYQIQSEIDERCWTEIGDGYPFSFNGSTYHIQLRAYTDFVSWLFSFISMLRSEVNGNGSVEIEVKVQENVRLSDTITNWVDRFSNAYDYLLSFYKSAWNHKDNVYSLYQDSTKTISDILSYDYSQNWP